MPAAFPRNSPSPCVPTRLPPAPLRLRSRSLSAPTEDDGHQREVRRLGRPGAPDPVHRAAGSFLAQRAGAYFDGDRLHPDVVGSAAIGAAVSRTIQPSWVGFVVIAVLMALSFILTILLAINLSPKRHISFYTDESKHELLLQVLQDKKFQPIVATYTVVDRRRRAPGTDEEELLVQFLPEEVGCPRRPRQPSAGRPRGFAAPLAHAPVPGTDAGVLRANFILVVPQAGNTETTRGEFNRNSPCSTVTSSI